MRQLAGQLRGKFPVDRAVGAGVVACPELAVNSVFIGAQNLRIFAGHPCGMGTGGGGEADLKTVVTRKCHKLVKTVKIPHIIVELKRCPGKDVQRYDIDMGQSEEAHIFLPDFFRPLLRIIVPTEEDFMDAVTLYHDESPFCENDV